MRVILLTPDSLHPCCRESLNDAFRPLDHFVKSTTGDSALTILREVNSILLDQSYQSYGQWALIRPALGCVREWWCAGDAIHWAAIDGLIAVKNGLIVEYELENAIDDQDEIVLRFTQSDPQTIRRLLSQINRGN